MLKVKLKKLHEKAVVPKYSKDGDAALDLVAISEYVDYNYLEYSTGLAIEIPENHVGLLFARSSVTNKSLFLGNAVGVIDSNYRGEIKFRFYINDDIVHTRYNIGDRIGQIMILPYPTIEFVEVDTLTDTNRGEGGYGSTGK